MSYNYYQLPKEEQKAIRQKICDRAYQEIPKNLDEPIVVNLGYGIPMGIINCIESDKDRKPGEILLQGETCVIGMAGFLEKGDPRIKHNHVDPAGNPILVSEYGARNISMADAFAFINSKKIYATFLGALQVAANGDLANWAVSEDQKYGAGGAMALVRGVRKVIICMVEENKYGESKLVKKCTIPLTGEKCVSLIITDKGVYKPMGDSFKVLEKFNFEKGIYEKINN